MKIPNDPQKNTRIPSAEPKHRAEILKPCARYISPHKQTGRRFRARIIEAEPTADDTPFFIGVDDAFFPETLAPGDIVGFSAPIKTVEIENDTGSRARFNRCYPARFIVISKNEQK